MESIEYTHESQSVLVVTMCVPWNGQFSNGSDRGHSEFRRDFSLIVGWVTRNGLFPYPLCRNPVILIAYRLCNLLQVSVMQNTTYQPPPPMGQVQPGAPVVNAPQNQQQTGWMVLIII